MKFYITRNGYNYSFSLTHPRWAFEWGNYRWVTYNGTGMCVTAGNRLLKGLGIQPLRGVRADMKVMIQVKLNTRTKTWEATEWVAA